MKMNFKYAQSSLALALGLSLAGCQTVTPLAVLGPSSSATSNPGVTSQVAAPVTQQIPEITPIGMSEIPKVELASTVTQAESGQLKFAIRWPERAERTTQVIPTSANTLRVRIYRASDSVDVVNELFARPAAPQQYYDYTQNKYVTPPNVVSKSYSLAKDTAYKVEVKVYAEAAASVTAGSTAIAYTATPADVTLSASQTQNLALTLSALYTPVIATSSYAVGSGASLTIAGSGFGTDSNLVKLTYKTSNTDSGTDYSANITSVTNNAITFTVPSNSFYSSGNLYVSRDGVDASGSIALYPISNLNVPNTGFKQANLNQAPWNINMAIAGATYSVVPTANGYIGNSYTQFDNATYSIQVLDKTTNATGVDVTSQLVSGGIITFPNSAKKYTIKAVSGNVNGTLDVQSGTLSGWPTSVATISVAPYYLPNFGVDGEGNPLSNSVDLTGVSLTAPDATVNLSKDDIDWSYGGNANVAIDTTTSQPWPRENPSNTKVIFKATSSATGTVPVTGSLKGAPANTFSFNANVVKLQGMGLQGYGSATSWNWTNLATASLPTNGTLDVRIGSYTLSDGQVVSLANTDREKLSPYNNSTVTWSLQNNTNGSSQSPMNYAQTTVTAGGTAGTPTIRMKYNPETTLFGTIVITVQ